MRLSPYLTKHNLQTIYANITGKELLLWRHALALSMNISFIIFDAVRFKCVVIPVLILSSLRNYKIIW